MYSIEIEDSDLDDNFFDSENLITVEDYVLDYEEILPKH